MEGDDSQRGAELRREETLLLLLPDTMSLVDVIGESPASQHHPKPAKRKFH